MEERQDDKIFSEASQVELKIYDCLKQVLDPEVGLNIIDMGLVYTIQYKPDTGIHIDMTLTSKGCPLGGSIQSEIERVIQANFPDVPLDVQIVWEPKWTIQFISAEGRKQLGQ